MNSHAPKKTTRHFRPGIVTTIATIVVGSLFAGLGYWQLQRAAIKESIEMQLGSAARETPIELRDQAAPMLHLNPVTAGCRYQLDKQLLLDNRVHQKRVGFEVIIPCVLENGRAVLVNRGWIAGDVTRTNLPNVSIESDLIGTPSGMFSIPGEGFSLGTALDSNDSDWPRLVQYYDFDAISDALGVPLVKGVLYLPSDDPLALTYTWKPVAFGPEKHYGYALQWFALMVTVLVLYIVLNFKRLDSENDSE